MYSTPEINTNQRHNPSTKMKHNNQNNHLPKINCLTTVTYQQLYCFVKHTTAALSVRRRLFLLINLLQPHPPMCAWSYACICVNFNCICLDFLTVFVNPTAMSHFLFFKIVFYEKVSCFLLTRTIFSVVIMLVKIGAGSQQKCLITTIFCQSAFFSPNL